MDKEVTFKRIEINPEIMLGKPVIAGTRIPVYVILNLLAEGYSTQEILGEYPDLKEIDVKAAISFASMLSSFEEPKLKYNANNTQQFSD